MVAVIPDARAMATAAVSPLLSAAPAAPSVELPQARGLRVQTVTVSAPIEEKSYTGVVTARYQTTLGFRVGGRITARLVEVGQVVREGDVLMMLDPADLDAGLRAAEANLAAARAQAVQATAEEARQSQLLESGWIAQARYDIAKAAAEGAAEAVRAAGEAARLARLVTFLFIASTPKHREVNQAREAHLTYKMLQLRAIIERGRQTTPNRHAYTMQARIDARNLDLRAAKTMEQALMVFEAEERPGEGFLTDSERRHQMGSFRDRLARAEKVGGS